MPVGLEALPTGAGQIFGGYIKQHQHFRYEEQGEEGASRDVCLAERCNFHLARADRRGMRQLLLREGRKERRRQRRKAKDEERISKSLSMWVLRRESERE